MKNVKETILKGMVKVVESVVNVDGSGWPPQCIGYIYQPKRPIKKKR